MSRRQVARIALRNRPVKAFRQIKSYVNGLISTRLPEELEWVEEHIEDDSHYGMDFPNDGECLPCCCSREYSTGSIRTRSLVTQSASITVAGVGDAWKSPGVPGTKVKNVVNATPSVDGVGIYIEITCSGHISSGTGSIWQPRLGPVTSNFLFALGRFSRTGRLNPLGIQSSHM